MVLGRFINPRLLSRPFFAPSQSWGCSEASVRHLFRDWGWSITLSIWRPLASGNWGHLKHHLNDLLFSYRHLGAIYEKMEIPGKKAISVFFSSRRQFGSCFLLEHRLLSKAIRWKCCPVKTFFIRKNGDSIVVCIVRAPAAKMVQWTTTTSSTTSIPRANPTDPFITIRTFERNHSYL